MNKNRKFEVLEETKIIYNNLAKVMLVFGVDITTPGIKAAVKGDIYSSLEQIEDRKSYQGGW